MTLLPRRCKLCGHRSRRVRKERLPVTDYLTWLSWVCRDRIACRERRSLEGDTGIPSSENWRD